MDRTTSNTTKITTVLLPMFGGGRFLTNATNSEIASALNEDVWAHFYICALLVAMIVIVLSTTLYTINLLALKQTVRIKQKFLKSILSQDMTWFDSKTSLDFASDITTNVNLIKEAISEKLVIAWFLVSAFIFGIIIAFTFGWQLTLAIAGIYTVILVALSIYVGKSEKRLSEKEVESYSEAGLIAEEVFSSIRTVVAFGGEDKESQRYAESLKIADKSSLQKSFFSGLQSGIMWFLVFASFGSAFFYGIHLMIGEFNLPEVEKTYYIISIVTIVTSMTNLSQFLSFAVPNFETIASACGVSQHIYDVIDQRSAIDPFSKTGLMSSNLRSNIEFRNVNFHYPSRSDIQVLKGISFSAEHGQKVALAGRSGCGKSTCLQLLQRFYDPIAGEILIDGVNIKDINISHLRSLIGVVAQEPVLFSTTIAENIRFGQPEATQEDIVKAALVANCHNFIVNLSKGYETLVGENGAQLSGGQKQRIAIARAIVRNPKILLLDEATSALDAQSETIVQEALDKASEGRTTLIVSHRLSAVRKADLIVVIDQGLIVEKGTHEELMNLNGHYCYLRTLTRQVIESNAVEREKEEFEFEELPNSFTSESNGEDIEDIEVDEFHKEKKGKVLTQLMRMTLKDWKLLLIGYICSVIVGSSFPISGILCAEYFKAFQTNDISRISDVAKYGLIGFIAVATITGLAAVVQAFVLSKAGIRLTSQLRVKYFQHALKQEMSWFDKPRNAVGALTVRLSTDCANVQGATGIRISGILQATSSLIIGVIIGLFVLWKLALIISLSLPLLMFLGIFESLYSKSSAANERKAMENASRIATEAIRNIKTVASLGLESEILRRFAQEVAEAERAAEKSTRYRGLLYSLNFSICFLAYGYAFLSVPSLLSDDGIDFVDAILVIETIIYATWMLGIVLNTAPNVNEAISSAMNIMNFLNKSTKDSQQLETHKQEISSASVDYKHVKFRYPSRPETEILKDLTFKIDPGKTVALVGSSGCGKSTCLQLLLRFYEPNDGSVEMDGKSLKYYTFNNLRMHLGLVSQEPVLFNRTIGENIAYGANYRTVFKDEIISAAKEARIHHEFIAKLPMGYDTPLGPRGAHLSGGQKQRIAIARALIRRPKILLLDEATSALDAESEQSVQETLNRASANRTCIIVTHRLSSIRNADLICVLDRGEISEMGSHDELMSAGGVYSRLYKSFA